MRLLRSIFIALPLAAAGAVATLDAQQWPTFRGPGAAGVADGQQLPAEWDIKTGKNIRWKTEIPGLSHSSPIVWGKQIFVTTAIPDVPVSIVLGDAGTGRAKEAGSYSWRLYAVDATNGRIQWQQEVKSGAPRTQRHDKASQANATPATDGRSLVAIFGSGDIATFTLDGKLTWKADLGVLDPGMFSDQTSQWGHASSPILFENLAIVQVDRHRESYLTAFDLDSGKRVWTVNRNERPVWATPTLLRTNGRDELIVVGGYHVRGYDPRTGQELWRFADDAQVKTPTPFVSDGLIVFAGGYRGRPIYALKTGGRGDLSVPAEATSQGHLAWRTEPGGPYTSTPVAYKGVLYGVRDEGVLFAYDMKTGQRVWRERSNATHAASLLASDDRIYVPTEEGEILVLKAGRTFELLARNDMGETCMATPAISDRTLFVRTRNHLYAIGTSADKPKTVAAAPRAAQPK